MPVTLDLPYARREPGFELGEELLGRMMPLWHWIITSAGRFRAARVEYDAS